MHGKFTIRVGAAADKNTKMPLFELQRRMALWAKLIQGFNNMGYLLQRFEIITFWISRAAEKKSAFPAFNLQGGVALRTAFRLFGGFKQTH
ncbi:hypothetical protein A4G17_05010 [Frederiksenia canicola]|uniref:Uncharacterized protein n=1 Tax=Frederiksenia canicola TaxID=123824 RepID=A0AAE6X576_9PAST|nr:hypothetical protein A4G17_05010 [Frederiksenia canicola]